jgi:hypothetical protein
MPVASGVTMSAALFGTSGQLGAGATLTRHDLRGSTRVSAEFGRSFWESPESVARHTQRDRIGVERQLRIDAGTTAWAIVNWSRYRATSRSDLSSGSMVAGVVRTVRRARPTLTLQYGLDIERRFVARTATTLDARPPAAIGLVSREVHVAGLIGRFPLALWDVETAAGYTADRLGGRGTFMTARMTPRPGRRVGVELWAERRLYALATTQQEMRAGLALNVRVLK